MGRGSTVSVAGNICIDVLVRDVAEASDAVDGAEVARDGWGANVQLHQRPIEPTIGGGGVGLALVLAHFGHEVDLNTNLGTDPWGDMAARQVRAAGVSLRPPQPEASATNVILLRRDGRRTSHYYPGPAVDWKRSLEATAPSSESASIWFFASGFGRVEEEDLRQLLAVFAEFRRRGASTVFDPSPWFGYKGVPAELMRAVFRELTCLVATEEELRPWQRSGSAEELACDLLDAGPDRVVVKRGAAGAVWACRQEGSGSVPTEPIESGNTTGAGDSFNGRLLHELSRGARCAAAVAAAVDMATEVARRGVGISGVLGPDANR